MLIILLYYTISCGVGSLRVFIHLLDENYSRVINGDGFWGCVFVGVFLGFVCLVGFFFFLFKYKKIPGFLQ